MIKTLAKNIKGFVKESVLTLEELEKILKPENYTGRAKEQTEDFLNECIKPVLEKYADVESDKPEINV